VLRRERAVEWLRADERQQQEGSVTTSTSDPVPKGDGERSHSIEERNTGQAKADLAAEVAPGDRAPDENLQQRQDELLDEAVEETFPASDPISPKRITR